MSEIEKNTTNSNSIPIETIVISKRLFEGTNVEDYEFPLAIVEYVNSMQENCLFDRTELPAKTIQAYHSDYYLCQVNNGGHSQFIHNSGKNLMQICKDARKGLLQMKASEHLKLFDQLMNWMANSPEEVRKQTGFEGGIADELEELDTQFFKLQRVSPLNVYATNWIRSWKELKGVDDVQKAMRELARNNPKRKKREIFREILKLSFWFTDPLRGPVGLTAISTARPEFVLDIFPSESRNDLGEYETYWVVKTTKSARFAILRDNETCLYERVATDSIPPIRIGNIRSVFKIVKALLVGPHQKPHLGRCLNRIPTSVSSACIQSAVEWRLAAATHMLLTNAGISHQCESFALIKPIKKRMPKAKAAATILIENTTYFVFVTETKATLLDMDNGTTLAVITNEKVKSHVERNSW